MAYYSNALVTNGNTNVLLCNLNTVLNLEWYLQAEDLVTSIFVLATPIGLGLNGGRLQMYACEMKYHIRQ
jgi:hypothetical protein